MIIRQSTNLDKIDIETLQIKAFGKNKGPQIATLVNDLFDDETALPLFSFAAVENDELIGHILFTNVFVTNARESVPAQILAPLAVLPEFQKKGMGSQLIKKGLDQLRESGVHLVFVLGHPEYYPRSGFVPAGALGFQAPYPIPKEHADAWMVQELSFGAIEKSGGKVRCSEVLSQPEHWRE